MIIIGPNRSARKMISMVDSFRRFQAYKKEISPCQRNNKNKKYAIDRVSLLLSLKNMIRPQIKGTVAMANNKINSIGNTFLLSG